MDIEKTLKLFNEYTFHSAFGIYEIAKALVDRRKKTNIDEVLTKIQTTQPLLEVYVHYVMYNWRFSLSFYGYEEQIIPSDYQLNCIETFLKTQQFLTVNRNSYGTRIIYRDFDKNYHLEPDREKLCDMVKILCGSAINS